MDNTKSTIEKEKTVDVALIKSKNVLNNAVPFLGLAVIIIVFQILSNGRLLSGSNFKVLFNDIFSIMIGACGLVFLMSTGEFDLSMSGIAAVSGLIAAYASSISPDLVFPVCLLMGVLIGAINGWIITKFRISAFVGTLAMYYVLWGLAQVMGSSGSVNVPVSMLKLDTVELKLIAMFVVMILGYILFEYTAYGKRCKAIGSRKEAAIQSGVKIESVRRMAFMITGLVSGIAAFFIVVRTGSASYQTGVNISFNSLIALLLGGMSISGGASSRFRMAIIGSIAMGILTNGMSLWGIDGIMQEFVRGIVFVITVSLTFSRESGESIK